MGEKNGEPKTGVHELVSCLHACLVLFDDMQKEMQPCPVPVPPVHVKAKKFGRERVGREEKEAKQQGGRNKGKRYCMFWKKFCPGMENFEWK